MQRKFAFRYVHKYHEYGMSNLWSICMMLVPAADMLHWFEKRTHSDMSYFSEMECVLVVIRNNVLHLLCT